MRAVLEEVRDDPSLHKVVLTRGRPLADADALAGERVTIVPMDTPDGQAAMVRCGLMLADDTPDVAYPFTFPRSRHAYVHLGVGLPVLPIGSAGDGDVDADWARLSGLAACSQGEALVRVATVPRPRARSPVGDRPAPPRPPRARAPSTCHPTSGRTRSGCGSHWPADRWWCGGLVARRARCRPDWPPGRATTTWSWGSGTPDPTVPTAGRGRCSSRTCPTSWTCRTAPSPPRCPCTGWPRPSSPTTTREPSTRW
ncbi:hypothetical protein [Nocardioides sp. B-3]|uniref:hypothetical protein n=1 Tax=Nocardioides sp. B-3 TaxID=2895565 RepID=UPI0021531482|nr:hypothetical protein [Nocardioides sp. B-3]UUZ60020.1 hypothetical protein LP418_03110 [Nocardioides sp. B-3]